MADLSRLLSPRTVAVLGGEPAVRVIQQCRKLGFPDQLWAVHPTRQGEGLGALLINESLHKALTTDWTRVILVGDEPYYRRFGFSRATASKLSFPPPTNPDRLLARELVPGAFCGVGGLVQNWAEWQPRHAGNFRL